VQQSFRQVRCIIAGILIVFAILFIDKIKVDDPVGAISVHDVFGVWCTLAAGIFDMGGFSMKLIGVHLIGIAPCFI